MELIFEIRDEEEGGFYARALGHSIFTEAETWDELRANLLAVCIAAFRRRNHATPAHADALREG